MKNLTDFTLCVAVAALLLPACSTSRKLENLKINNPRASLSLPDDGVRRFPDVPLPVYEAREGVVMRAVRDESTGEMVASEELNSAYVSARFRNIAERHGLVRLEFDISVGDSLLDRGWRLRFLPLMVLGTDTLGLEPLYVTGEAFREGQLRGYRRYDRFLGSISRDSSRFVDAAQLEIFSLRNRRRPLVSGDEALDHFTNKALVGRNRRKLERRDVEFARLVPNPIGGPGVRLDTVVVPGEGFVFRYIHTFRTRPRLKKAQILVCGDVSDAGGTIWRMPPSEPLSYYISSLSSFADSSIARKGDSLYMAGMRALEDRDFPGAITLLHPYADFNAAVAYAAMGYDASASAILEGLPRSAAVCYLLAILRSRKGQDDEAVELFLEACGKEPSLRHRGNLDPEISFLVKRYNLERFL